MHASACFALLSCAFVCTQCQPWRQGGNNFGRRPDNQNQFGSVGGSQNGQNWNNQQFNNGRNNNNANPFNSGRNNGWNNNNNRPNGNNARQDRLDRNQANEIAQALRPGRGRQTDRNWARRIAQNYGNNGNNNFPNQPNNGWPATYTTTLSPAAGSIISTQEQLKALLGLGNIDNNGGSWQETTYEPGSAYIPETTTYIDSAYTDYYYPESTIAPSSNAFAGILDMLKPIQQQQGLEGVIQVLGDPTIFSALGTSFIANLLSSVTGGSG